MSDTFSANVDKVSNDEVKKSADDADTAMTSLVSEFKKYAEDPTSADTEKLTTAANDVQSTFTELSTLCN